MQDYYLDTLVSNLHLHNNAGGSDFWLELPVEGLDSPDIRTTSFDKPGENGARVTNQYWSSRLVTLTGKFQGSSLAQYETNRQKLASALRIRRDTNGRPIAIRSQFTLVTGDQFWFDAYVATKPIFNWDYMNWGSFIIQLIVPISIIYGITQRTTGSFGIRSAPGTTLPWTLPVTLAASSGGIANLVNNGNDTAVPSITITGPATNPLVQNRLTNEYMQVNYALSGGSTITIDMLEKTILLNGTTPLLSYKSAGSTWWGIEPGITPIAFQTSIAGETGTAEVKAWDSYSGI